MKPCSSGIITCALLITCGVITGVTSAANVPAAGSNRPALWLDAVRGEPLSFEDVILDLQRTTAVFVGEYHTIPRHHQLEKDALEALVNRGIRLVLAMEQFEFFSQPILDRFNLGEITVDELVNQANLSKRWPGYTNYVPLLRAAAKHSIPVLALNARAETIRAIGRAGLANLTPEQQRELPRQMLTNDPPYRKVLDRVLGVHMAFDAARLQPAFEAQVARDETMAMRLAEFLKSPQGQGRSALVICGRGHCEYGLGMPARLARRLPGVKQRIVLLTESGDLQLTEQERKQAREIEVSHEFLRAIGKPPCDYLHITGLADEAPMR